jgi:hypothetical protein
MASYRLYCLDGAGSISFADWIQAEDDTHALAQARELKQGALRCEVWEGNRFVAALSQNDLGLNPSTVPPRTTPLTLNCVTHLNHLQQP